MLPNSAEALWIMRFLNFTVWSVFLTEIWENRETERDRRVRLTDVELFSYSRAATIPFTTPRVYCMDDLVIRGLRS